MTNGGFETGDFTGWTVTGGCILVSASESTLAPPCNAGVDTDPGPHGGRYAAYFGDPLLGSISQSFDTTVGQGYVISFYLANTSFGGLAAPNSMDVTLDGNTLLTVTNSGTFPYLLYTYSTVATSTSSTLTFSASQNPAFWVLDDVTVSPVPEPGPVLLMGTGLIGLGARERRRRG
ncbi:MAG: PEP-CTERM sorting domain-containing protein [Acidobacteria bacterium]|nr:PEP-CTERM sorting domain-containing protein [Acidobacteriota bacterium]